VFKVLMASQHHSAGKATAGKGACEKFMMYTRVYSRIALGSPVGEQAVHLKLGLLTRDDLWDMSGRQQSWGTRRKCGEKAERADALHASWAVTGIQYCRSRELRRSASTDAYNFRLPFIGRK
jgi:hypothetical protein